MVIDSSPGSVPLTTDTDIQGDTLNPSVAGSSFLRGLGLFFLLMYHDDLNRHRSFAKAHPFPPPHGFFLAGTDFVRTRNPAPHEREIDEIETWIFRTIWSSLGSPVALSDVYSSPPPPFNTGFFFRDGSMGDSAPQGFCTVMYCL